MQLLQKLTEKENEVSSVVFIVLTATPLQENNWGTNFAARFLAVYYPERDRERKGMYLALAWLELALALICWHVNFHKSCGRTGIRPLGCIIEACLQFIFPWLAAGFSEKLWSYQDRS